ncbi:hypothetical protein OG298_41375 [Streptomyces sp. NBC_01005]|uniref:hypothetical protein n=1 Tax=unclassified Streptomyces TaxID=2593676 RepID=UPI0038701DD9|nr:hypothetical protein OG298_41375 [Streptomyces sp. NBC_01005]WTC99777.1 hypothetical protein OH736_41380 [Streptomyces sp. NBC_01650]
MPCELIERMAACDDCRNLAVDYGMYLIGSRRYNADPRHWGLHLTTTRIHLDNHLITAHAAWLPDRQPDCGTCEAWREDHNARCRLGANFPLPPSGRALSCRARAVHVIREPRRCWPYRPPFEEESLG